MGWILKRQHGRFTTNISEYVPKKDKYGTTRFISHERQNTSALTPALAVLPAPAR